MVSIGRVVAADGETFVVELDGERSIHSGRARPGDWVRVVEPDEEGDDGAPLVEVLTPTGRDPFPPVDGEWFRLHRDPDRVQRHGGRRFHNLHRRAAALRALRAFFDDERFLEIEAPLRVPSPGLELHLDAFSTDGRFLITSPEYQMKRLLAAGLPRIYSVCRCFRRKESGAQHNPEFTMVEWYRAPGRWEEIASDVEQLCARVVEAVTGHRRVSHRGEEIDLTPPWERLSVREAMARHAGVALDGDEPVDELIRKGRAAGHRIPDGTSAWDDAFFAIFLDAVEQKLGRGRPTILFDWPAPLGALARRKPDEPRLVERFEAYAAGLELCNGFGELIDPVEQRARLERDLAERRRRGLPEYPIDERFLGALVEGLPPSAGVALGFDRLVMLACDAATIRDVSAFVDDEL